MNIEEGNITYRDELFRKAIHLVSLSIPLVYLALDKRTMLFLLLPVLTVTVWIDFLSRKNAYLMKMFGMILRPHERKTGFNLNGASWVIISAICCILVFPKIVAVTAFTILIISDLTAALIGRKFGKRRLFDKSWEGTGAFIFSAIIIIFIYWSALSAPVSFLITGIIAAVVGGFVEAASKVISVDDNLSIPLSIGGILWAGGSICAGTMPYLDLL